MGYIDYTNNGECYNNRDCSLCLYYINNSNGLMGLAPMATL